MDMADDSNLQENIESNPLESVFCGSLRSKKFFMTAALANQASDYLDGSNHCWCRETQQAIGPDGGMAQPDHCVPGRSCYSSAFEA
jgi:hypothetical protein